MASVYSRDTGVAVASCIWMKNPYIKKGTLPVTPAPTSIYISSSIILPVSGGWNNILSCKWLQWGLNNNIMTYMFKPFSCNIPNLIMTCKYESPMAANRSMIGRKGFTTHTMIRDVGQSPTISKMYSIPEFMFSQMETLIMKREPSTKMRSPSHYLNPWLSEEAGIVWHTLPGP